MKFIIAIIFLLFTGLSVFAADPAPASAATVVVPDPAKFPLPSLYKPNVDFWTRVYGEWSTNTMVIHDAWNINIIFDIIELPDQNTLAYLTARPLVNKRVTEIKAILTELHTNPASRDKSADHKKFYELYRNINDASKFKTAAENVRVQGGIKDRFERGLTLMTLYIDMLRRVFREEGVPEELAYLPLVESSFINASVSKTNAAGIFQFMPATARLYGLKVNNDVDERLDPYIVGRAAAKYLRGSYSKFRSWPASITSYNHGPGGMAAAIRTVGTADWGAIYTRYKGKSFGFASRNFYAEFLAAYKVMYNARHYFGEVKYSAPLLHDSIKLHSPLWVSTLTKNANVSPEEIRTNNPALQTSVIFSKRPIPSGYILRMPKGRIPNLASFISNLPKYQAETKKPVTVAEAASKAKQISAPASKTYVVRKGDTLSSIARKFSTSVETIRKINRLSKTTIRPGQKLLVRSH